MKKLLVEDYTVDDQLATEISLRLSSHFMYGTYNFNPERMVEDICQEYNLELVEIRHPDIILKNAAGKTLNLKVSEENYGY